MSRLRNQGKGRGGGVVGQPDKRWGMLRAARAGPPGRVGAQPGRVGARPGSFGDRSLPGAPAVFGGRASRAGRDAPAAWGAWGAGRPVGAGVAARR